jgi:hypothetical protein
MTARRRIVFLGNHTRTEFFRRVSKYMDSDTTRVSWVVVNAAQRASLLQTHPPEDVLYLPLSLPLSDNAAAPLKINDLLFCDRRLKFMLPRGKRYLQAIQPAIQSFLKSEVPTLVVGELTLSYEIVAYRLVQGYLPNCRWVSLAHTRMPPNHFSFYEDEAFSREVWRVPQTGIDDGAFPEGEVDGPDYVALNRNITAFVSSRGFLLSKLRRFFSMEGYDPEDPTYHSNTRWDKLRKNVPFLVNRLTYRGLPKVGVDAIRACKGRSVIFPLHLQPEANIDTCGRYWDNQAETILKIWRQLGPDDALFIKEHPVAIGNRGWAFYKRLLAYPNLHLLRHTAPIPEVLDAVDYVFTIAGTMGMEAALSGGKVLCLAPTTYDRLANVVSPTISDFRRCGTIEDLYETLRAEKTGGWDARAFKTHMAQYAWPGDGAGDLNANPGSWAPGNLTRVARALERVLAQIGEPRP